MKNDLIDLFVRSRDQVLYEGKVRTITSKNKKGEFAVLPLHANFISLLEESLILTDEHGDKKNIPVFNGVLKVRQNRVEVYVGIKK